MDKLERARKQINNIDAQIVKLFEQRMKAVEDVANYKLANNLPILDTSREKALLEKNLSLCTDNKFKKYYPIVLEGFLKASKLMQKELLKK